MRSRPLVAAAVLLAFVSTSTPTITFAADAPPAAAKPAVRSKLPDEHDYQKELRRYLGTLTEKDFDHGVTALPTLAPVTDPEDLYRTFQLLLEFPKVGRKRCAPSLNLPPKHFLLTSIEDPERGIVRPHCWPEPTAFITTWKYAGNPYFGSRAVKLRAFTTMTLLMLMTDELQEHSTSPKDSRTDWFGPHLAAYGYTYKIVKDVLPPETRAAFETCLKKMMQRVVKWGPRGDETQFDICAVLGMRLAADSLADPESMKVAETYARRVFSDERFYNPAGYFTDQGGFDGGFQGMSLYWGTWLALAAPDWQFVQDAVKKTWRLRGYLLLPEPGPALPGVLNVVGPSHFNARTSDDVFGDQWGFHFRNGAGALLTDDAISQAPAPTEEVLGKTVAGVVSEVGMEITEKPGSGEFVPNDKLVSHPWSWSMYPSSNQFPMNNFGYDYFPANSWAHRQDVAKKNPEMLKLPFARAGSFTEAFDKSFFMGKRDTFGVIVHTGNVSEFQGEGHIEFLGPYGFSGGSLSAFWTPATGTVLLGRRGGMPFPNSKIPNYDTPDMWRTWPVHAITGETASGKVFTSARCLKPVATFDLSGKKKLVSVTGTIPAVTMVKEKSLDGKIDYARSFEMDDKGLSVTTSVKGDGVDQVAELYEVLPVFLKEAGREPAAVPTVIEFKTGGAWAPATDQATNKVEAIRLTRFGAAVVITFDSPRRAKLSPNDWADRYLGHASCRNVLVDLLENDGKAVGIKDAKKISYRIEAAGK